MDVGAAVIYVLLFLFLRLLLPLVRLLFDMMKDIRGNRDKLGTKNRRGKGKNILDVHLWVNNAQEFLLLLIKNFQKAIGEYTCFDNLKPLTRKSCY